MSNVLVTGGSRGIGSGICRVLGRNGHHVLIGFNKNRQSAEELRDEIAKDGGNAEVVAVDVQSSESISNALSAAQQLCPTLDVVISNAAFDPGGDLENADIDSWNGVLATKLTGAFLLTKLALPYLKRSDNPQVIYITSNEAEKPQPDFLAYGCATGGLTTFAKAMAKYLPKFGVRANCVSPGTVRTELWGPAINDDEMWEKLAQKNPLHRVATPEDVGEACRMLIEDPTRYLNGNFIYVNGGNHL